MAKDKIAVSKIVLKLDGKEVELTIKQAMELKKLLNDTFPDKVVKEYIPYPVTPYIVPYYVEPYIYRKRWNDWEIYCGDIIDGTVGSSQNYYTLGTLYMSNNSMEEYK